MVSFGIEMVMSGEVPPAPTFAGGAFWGRSTTITGASLPSRVASLPSDGRNVLNSPVVKRPVVLLLSCRHSAPPCSAWLSARLMNGDETPSAMWYGGLVIETGGAS